MHFNYEAARGLVYAAKVHRRAGDRAAAAEPLRRALDLFTSFESKLDVERVVASMEMLKARTNRLRRGVGPMTPRSPPRSPPRATPP